MGNLQPDSALSAAEDPAKLGVTLASVPTPAANITVNHDNVLRAASIIADAVNNEGAQIIRELGDLQVIAPGADTVSVQAAAAWNAKLLTDDDSYAARIKQYLTSLGTVANNLAAAARQYGYTDDQIAQAFRQTGASGTASA